MTGYEFTFCSVTSSPGRLRVNHNMVTNSPNLVGYKLTRLRIHLLPEIVCFQLIKWRLTVTLSIKYAQTTNGQGSSVYRPKAFFNLLIRISILILNWRQKIIKNEWFKNFSTYAISGNTICKLPIFYLCRPYCLRSVLTYAEQNGEIF